MSDIQSRPSAFLPPPRLPNRIVSGNAAPPADLLDSLNPGSGDPARAMLALRDEALGAVDDLEDHRPGGQAWRAALAADAKAVQAGQTPRKWAAARVLGSDHDRWARASALVRTLSGRWDEQVLVLRADRALAKAAEAALVKAQRTLADKSVKAWRLVADGSDKANMWASFYAASEARDEATRLRGLLAYLSGRDVSPDLGGWGPGWDEATAGYFMACDSVLNGRRHVTLPKGVAWPRDYDPTTGLARSAAVTGLLTAGYAERDG